MSSERYVLCVDDEPLLLEGLELTLRDSFEVITETKPLAALALLERHEHEFVAIVSDMRMPLMDGARFLACAAGRARVALDGRAPADRASPAQEDPALRGRGRNDPLAGERLQRQRERAIARCPARCSLAASGARGRAPGRGRRQ